MPSSPARVCAAVICISRRRRCPRSSSGQAALRDPKAETAGLRTYQLRFGDRVLATLRLDAPPAAVFSVDECARGLEIVIGSAWSRARAGQATDELAALDTATRGIAGVLDLDRVLQLITDRVRELAHAQYAALGIVDQDGGIERFITSGISPRGARADRRRRRAATGCWASSSARTAPSGSTTSPPTRAATASRANHPAMHSLLGVPIGAKGRSIGRLYLTNKQPSGDFTEDDERIVEMFALHAGIAIENARLHEQVQRLAIVEERERIGRDLHDGIIQSIYAVGLSLEDVPELMADEPEVARARVERAIDSLDQSIRDIRNFIFGLRPELLEQAGLVGGLAALADEFRVNSMVDVDLDTAGDRGQTTCRPTWSASCCRSRARPSATSPATPRRPAATSTSSTEDGSPAADRSPTTASASTRAGRARAGHQGLINMRARAASVGGRLDVQSEPGAGTRIIVEVPRREACDAP